MDTTWNPWSLIAFFSANAPSVNYVTLHTDVTVKKLKSMEAIIVNILGRRKEENIKHARLLREAASVLSAVELERSRLESKYEMCLVELKEVKEMLGTWMQSVYLCGKNK